MGKWLAFNDFQENQFFEQPLYQPLDQHQQDQSQIRYVTQIKASWSSWKVFSKGSAGKMVGPLHLSIFEPLHLAPLHFALFQIENLLNSGSNSEFRLYSRLKVVIIGGSVFGIRPFINVSKRWCNKTPQNVAKTVIFWEQVYLLVILKGRTDKC